MTDLLLRHELRVVLELKERLQSEFDLSDDDEALWGTIDGESALSDRLVGMLRVARHREASAAALKSMIDDMSARKKRFESGAEKLRALVTWSLSEIGQRKLEAPDLTAHLSTGRRPVIITDEELVPDYLCRIRKEPDKLAIRAELEAGRELSFAGLGNQPQILTVKTR